jgi:hypothetical protein
MSAFFFTCNPPTITGVFMEFKRFYQGFLTTLSQNFLTNYLQ